jgi:hypothetical protein
VLAKASSNLTNRPTNLKVMLDTIFVFTIRRSVSSIGEFPQGRKVTTNSEPSPTTVDSSRERVKYCYESHETQNQESVCW